MTDFELWPEHAQTQDLIDDICNVSVTFATGERYGLQRLDVRRLRRLEEDGQRRSQGAGHTYMEPPDLFVSNLSRATFEAVFRDLINRGMLPEHCRVAGDEED